MHIAIVHFVELLIRQIANLLEARVSLQKADWHIIKKDGEPEESNRYLIVYMYKDNKQMQYFIGDYDTYYGWNCKLDNIEILAWHKIPIILMPEL